MRSSALTASRRIAGSQAHRSIRCWSSTPCSAKPCRTSRSTPSPISVMRRGPLSARRLSGRYAARGFRGDRPSRPTPTARPASSRPHQASTRTAKPVLSYVRALGHGQQTRRGRVDGPPLPPDPPSPLWPSDLALPLGLDFTTYDFAACGSPHAFDDYEIGEKSITSTRMTVEEAEHQLATRLYQNTAKVHFDALARRSSRFGKRLIYGGVRFLRPRARLQRPRQRAAHARDQCRPPRHPLFAGDTVYAWSEVLDNKADGGAGALRLRLLATKNRRDMAFPANGDPECHPRF